MKEQKVLKFINKLLFTLESNINSSTFLDKEKEKQKIRLEVVNEIKKAFEWGVSSDESKQTKRILQIAKYREQGLDVKNKLNQINLYAKIKDAIPYIQAVSYKINNEEKHLTENLLNFCEKQLDLIDSSLFKRYMKFPNKTKIDIAFKNYNEKIKLNQIPSLKVYNQPEVREKIEKLYTYMLKLSNDE